MEKHLAFGFFVVEVPLSFASKSAGPMGTRGVAYGLVGARNSVARRREIGGKIVVWS